MDFTDVDDMPEEGYTDSRGVDIGPLGFREALSKVCETALVAMPDEDDIARDGSLRETARYAEAALETVGRLSADEAFLDGLEPSLQAREWPDEAIHPSCRSDGNDNALGATRLVLGLACVAARDPASVQGVAEAEEADRQQAAIDMVCDLLGMHGAALDAWRPAAPAPAVP